MQKRTKILSAGLWIGAFIGSVAVGTTLPYDRLASRAVPFSAVIGLLATSIWPTMTMLVNSMKGNSLSVQGNHLLHNELKKGVRLLTTMFFNAALLAVLLGFISLVPEREANNIIRAFQQSIIGVIFFLFVLLTRTTPYVFMMFDSVLSVNFQNALEEAEVKLERKAVLVADEIKGFSDDEEFGASLGTVPRPN